MLPSSDDESEYKSQRWSGTRTSKFFILGWDDSEHSESGPSNNPETKIRVVSSGVVDVADEAVLKQYS